MSFSEIDANRRKEADDNHRHHRPFMYIPSILFGNIFSHTHIRSNLLLGSVERFVPIFLRR